MVYPANAFDSGLRGDYAPLGSSSTKSQKKDFSGWRPAIAFLYFFLFQSLLRLASFLSQYKKLSAKTWQHTGTERRWSVTQEFLAYAIIRRNSFLFFIIIIIAIFYGFREQGELSLIEGVSRK